MKLTDKEHFDLENRLCEIEENSREKLFKAEEQRIVEKALKKDKDNMAYLNRAFPYLTEEHFLESVQALYPELNELFIVNLDERDSANIPLMRTVNLKPLNIYHSRTTNGYGTSCIVDTTFRLMLAVIEDGTAFIKSCKLSNGYYKKRR